ncbi:hypothetical protein C8Q80DRAFT_190744 [Daedaleopsis nitida]|nr:hypothetical protein C8Q80DRAFT_190744 [Daedaleopsis nitida]
MSGLFPGYKQVDAFGPDDAYESANGEVEEEVEYVTLDLGTVEPALVPSSSSYRLVGLETPTPFLQLSGTILKGQHVSLLGTELLFTESTTEEPHERGKRSLVHVANTERRIRFKEVELRPKRAGDVPDAQALPAVKSSSIGRVKMEHVMSGSAGPSRKGRGGRKRGRGAFKAFSEGRERAEEPTTDDATEQQAGDVAKPAGSASVQMDTSD